MTVYVYRTNLGWLDAAAGTVVVPPVSTATTTTTVTANATAGNSRDLLIPGTYTVDASTTGVRPGRTLTVTSTHVPVSNTTYIDLDIRNTVDLFNKTNVKYYDCVFRGAATRPAGTTGLATCYRPHGRGHVFTDCTFVPQLPDYRWVGIAGYGFTVRRCDYSIVCDPFQIYNNNTGTYQGLPERDAPIDVDIQQTYIHDQACFYPSGSVPTTDVKWGGGETQSDGSHSDGLQWEGGTGLIFKYNNLTGIVAPQYAPRFGQGGNQANSCLTIFPDVGAISNGNISFNDFAGGAVEINCGDKPAKNRVINDLGVVHANTFHGGQFFPPTDINVISSTTQNPGGVQIDLGSGATANHKSSGALATVTYSTVTP